LPAENGSYRAGAVLEIKHDGVDVVAETGKEGRIARVVRKDFRRNRRGENRICKEIRFFLRFGLGLRRDLGDRLRRGSCSCSPEWSSA
jgi:hypothetical protein